MEYRLGSRVLSSMLIVLSLLLPWYQFSDADSWSPGLVILIGAFAAPGGWTVIRLLSLFSFGALLASLWLGFIPPSQGRSVVNGRISLLISIVGFLWLALAYPSNWLWGIWGMIAALAIALGLSMGKGSALTALVILAVFLLPACESRSTGAATESTSALTILNHLDLDICEVRLSKHNHQEWEANLLDGSTLKAGEQFTLPRLENGMHDFRFVPCDSSAHPLDYYGVIVERNGTFPLMHGYGE